MEVEVASMPLTTCASATEDAPASGGSGTIARWRWFGGGTALQSSLSDSGVCDSGGLHHAVLGGDLIPMKICPHKLNLSKNLDVANGASRVSTASQMEPS